MHCSLARCLVPASRPSGHARGSRGPGALLALHVAGSPGPGAPCGPCELTFPTLGSLVATLQNGAFSVPIALPCTASLAGLEVVWQSAALPSMGPFPILTPFAISNRLSTTLDW